MNCTINADRRVKTKYTGPFIKVDAKVASKIGSNVYVNFYERPSIHIQFWVSENYLVVSLAALLDLSLLRVTRSRLLLFVCSATSLFAVVKRGFLELRENLQRKLRGKN